MLHVAGSDKRGEKSATFDTIVLLATRQEEKHVKVSRLSEYVRRSVKQ